MRRKTDYSTAVIIICGVAIAIGVAIAGTQGNVTTKARKPQTTTRKFTEPRSTTLAGVFKDALEFKAETSNLVKAERDYVGKRIRITSLIVEKVTVIDGKPVVFSNFTGLQSIFIEFPKGRQTDTLANIAYLDTVDIEATLDSIEGRDASFSDGVIHRVTR